jgi:hypothetical protein
MRLIRITAAFAATATLPVLSAPVTASARPHVRPHVRQRAHRHASPGGTCRISEFAEPHTITSGESVQVFGQLRCSGSGEGQTVTVFAASPGTSGFKALGTTTTGAGGFYSFVQSDVTASSLFYASAAGARSATREVRVAPAVTLTGPPEAQPLFTGFRNRVTFSGSVSPASVGATVVLQREAATGNEEWRGIAFGVVEGGGVYVIRHTFVRPGDANLRVVVRKRGRFTVRGISNTVSYGISQRENPALTIHTTAYTVAYGSPVTLTGNLAAGAGKTVTLLARSRSIGASFTTVTSTTTGPGGSYSFVQTPLVDTVYRVVSGPTNSAALFEGVKYVLSAGVSATTVQAGQPLTFAGTVTPGLVGKNVYLERENAFGGGFHVADVASVAAGGTYSMTDFVFGAGRAVFRVKVHGDRNNQQAVSGPFAIEVTPAPPGSLRPAAQPKQPKEGQI